MKAAIVRDAGRPPVFGDFAEPLRSSGLNHITVTAAAMSPLAKSRALGTHYSSSNQFPFIAGIDGVGRLEDGRRVYFVLPQPPYGSMAERVAVSSAHCLLVPDAIDDLTAAAIANPGMSSWAAFTERAKLVPGETVLINGATGTSGRLAVQIAKHLGARKVIATGRNANALQEVVALGADVTIPIAAESLEQRFEEQFAAGVDVVIDYLWGQSAECLLAAGAKAGADAVPIRFVQIGSSSGPNIALPSAALRSSAIELMGSGVGSIPLDRLLNAIAGVLHATAPAGLQIALAPVPLSEVEQAWRLGGQHPANRVHHGCASSLRFGRITRIVTPH